jgi:hypothetical protein
MEDGGWRMEDGGWRMEDGGWRMEGFGKLSPLTGKLYFWFVTVEYSRVQYNTVL